MYYEREIRALNKSKIKYLVVGGVAVNLYGLQRLTRDLDLMIDIKEDNLQKFVSLMDKLGYGTKISIDEWKGKVAIAFRHRSDDLKQIDIFVRNPIDFETAYRKKKIFKVRNTNVYCVSLDDLLRMKEIADRDRDWADIGYLKKYIKERRI